MDIEEYQRLKGKAEARLTEANQHIMGDLTFVGVGLAIEGQAYATLAAAEASRRAPSRRAVSAMRSSAIPIGADSEEILDGDEN